MGVTDICHRLNSCLQQFGGRIGYRYSIHPQWRPQDGDDEKLLLALPECRERGLWRVLFARDSENITFAEHDAPLRRRVAGPAALR